MPSGISVAETSPNRYSWNSCGIAPLSSRTSPPSTRSMPSSTPSTAVAARPTNEPPRNSRPIRLWSVEVNHAATDAGKDPIADSPRAAPTASGLDSIVVMYVGLACRACRGEDVERPPGTYAARHYPSTGARPEIPNTQQTDLSRHTRRLVCHDTRFVLVCHDTRFVLVCHDTPCRISTSRVIAPNRTVT